MELPLPSPPPLISSSSSSSSSSISTSLTNEMNISNASLLACDEQGARSYTNLTTSHDVRNHHQHECIDGSKKRKLAGPSSMLQEEAHASTITVQCRKREDQYRHGELNSDHELEEAPGCTIIRPGHELLQYIVQCACCKYEGDNCSIISKDKEEAPIMNDSEDDMTPTSAISIGCYMNGDGKLESSSWSCSGCSNILRRGPPPAPRKPKAKPRILKSNHLNFFIPPDLELELFFSSTTPPTNIYNHDDA